mmetsp:Transcript_128107/g.319696  ORF Transcript_128107/g.319696 Transcript_128107/m.319696 type:complete len:220 (-) Transcript_128107:199-858(-)
MTRGGAHDPQGSLSHSITQGFQVKSSRLAPPLVPWHSALSAPLRICDLPRDLVNTALRSLEALPNLLLILLQHLITVEDCGRDDMPRRPIRGRHGHEFVLPASCMDERLALTACRISVPNDHPARAEPRNEALGSGLDANTAQIDDTPEVAPHLLELLLDVGLRARHARIVPDAAAELRLLKEFSVGGLRARGGGQQPSTGCTQEMAPRGCSLCTCWRR